MLVGTDVDQSTAMGRTGLTPPTSGDFFKLLKSNYIGPDTLGSKGKTASVEIIPRIGGPSFRFENGLVEERKFGRNGYRMVGRQVGTEVQPSDVVNSPIAKDVGNAVKGSLIGKVLGLIGL